jgi:hypothetical protein
LKEGRFAKVVETRIYASNVDSSSLVLLQWKLMDDFGIKIASVAKLVENF